MKTQFLAVNVFAVRLAAALVATRNSERQKKTTAQQNAPVLLPLPHASNVSLRPNLRKPALEAFGAMAWQAVFV